MANYQQVSYQGQPQNPMYAQPQHQYQVIDPLASNPQQPQQVYAQVQPGYINSNPQQVIYQTSPQIVQQQTHTHTGTLG